MWYTDIMRNELYYCIIVVFTYSFIGVNKRRPPTKWTATFKALVGDFSLFIKGHADVSMC